MKIIEAIARFRAGGYDEALGFTVYDTLRYREALAPLVEEEVRVLLERLAGEVEAERAVEIIRSGREPLRELIGAMHSKLLHEALERAQVSFYEPLGDGRFASTPHTRGPWDPAFQHAGPPAALLGRALERCEPRDGLRARARDVRDPAPDAGGRGGGGRPGGAPGPLGRAARGRAGGRRRDDRERARLAREGDHAPDVDRDEPPPPRPDEATPLPPEMGEFGYGHAVELRFAAGGWWQHRPATVWTRMRVPLVAGEEPTGVQRVLVVADSGNGVSAVLPFDQWLFINTELTVHFRRPAARRVDLPRRRDLDRRRRRRPRALGAQRRRRRGGAGRAGAAGRAAWRLTHSCMATAEAAAALIERVEPNWRIASTAVASARASADRPGPSWPNSSTQRSGSG